MIARTADCRSRSSASSVNPSITGMLMSSSISSMSGSAEAPPAPPRRGGRSGSRIPRRGSGGGNAADQQLEIRLVVDREDLAESANGLSLKSTVACNSPQANLQEIEIDRLGDEFSRAAFGGAATPLVVAIGGQHHHRQFRPPLLDLPQERQPVHSGHIDVRQDDDQLRLDLARKTLKRLRGREREMQHVDALPHLAPKLLAEQLRDIGFVIDNQDANPLIPQLTPRDRARFWRRGCAADAR